MADTTHTILHVKDAYAFEVPKAMVHYLPSSLVQHHHFAIPQPFVSVPEGLGTPLVVHPEHHVLVPNKHASGLFISKFMILEVIAAILIFFIFRTVAKSLQKTEAPKGRFVNFFEMLLVFVRDEIAVPNIGESDAPKHTPFLWTIFFFVLTANLLGMVPWLGSSTGAFATTAALASIVLLRVIATGMGKFGVVGFWGTLCPHMDLEWYMAIVLKPMIWLIELVGLFMKHIILAIRLLANMFGGHVVLVVIMGFIVAPGTIDSLIWYGIMPASLMGSVAVGCLEIFVAFLQAYIFTFLSALFIGTAAHPH
jgi:F-type H+-transporting ATPase subunit a